MSLRKLVAHTLRLRELAKTPKQERVALQVNGVQIYGVADWENQNFDPSEMNLANRCYVDGEEIRCVLFADTAAGVVRTYDLLRNYSRCKYRRSGPYQRKYTHDEYTKDDAEERLYTPEEFPGREVVCGNGFRLVETLHGKVELFIV